MHFNLIDSFAKKFYWLLDRVKCIPYSTKKKSNNLSLQTNSLIAKLQISNWISFRTNFFLYRDIGEIYIIISNFMSVCISVHYALSGICHTLAFHHVKSSRCLNRAFPLQGLTCQSSFCNWYLQLESHLKVSSILKNLRPQVQFFIWFTSDGNRFYKISVVIVEEQMIAYFWF